MVKKLKNIEEKVETLDVSNFSGTCDNVITYIRELEKSAVSKGYHDISLNMYNYYEDSYAEVWGHRLETEVEYKARRKKELAAKKAKKTKKANAAKMEKLQDHRQDVEWPEYQRLKAKFAEV